MICRLIEAIAESMRLSDPDTYTLVKYASGEPELTYESSVWVPGATKRLAATGCLKSVVTADGTMTGCKIKYYRADGGQVYFVREWSHVAGPLL